MLAAALLTVIAFFAAGRYGEPPFKDAPTQRLLIAAKTDLFVMLWLAIAISNVARLRFMSPLDIAGSGAGPPSQRLRNAVAFLQNTLEQVGLAVPAHVILAAVYDHGAAIVPILGGMFC